MAAVLFLAIIVGLLFILYKRWVKYDYWDSRGLPYDKPIPIVGNMLEHARGKRTFGEVLMALGNKFSNEPLIGFYNLTKPAIIVNNNEYAEIILVKEFSRFMNRGEEMKLEDRRPLDKNLFFIGGVDWKAVRQKLTPVFTTGKLKGMLPVIEKILDKTIKTINSSPEALPLKDVVEIFTMSVRATCVFGLDMTESELDPEFVTQIREMSNFNFFNFLTSTIALWFPRVATKLNLPFFGKRNEGYFVDVLLKTFKERSESNVRKNDFIQTLLELKNTGKVEVHQWVQEDDFLKMDEKYSTTKVVEIDDDILMSQSYIFLLAGLEPLVSTLTMLLVELAQNPEILDKLREEINTTIDNHKEFDYQALKDMEYLELCIKETMRLHPPTEMIVRQCLKPYTFENGFTVEKGMDIFIPSYKFQIDPDLFPDPMVFKPERFDTQQPPCAFLPFGEGPRICIGMRFAMLEMKMFISKIVKNYNFTLDPRTELPVRTDKWFFLRRHTSPLFMKFTKIT